MDREEIKAKVIEMLQETLGTNIDYAEEDKLDDITLKGGVKGDFIRQLSDFSIQNGGLPVSQYEGEKAKTIKKLIDLVDAAINPTQ